MSMEPRGTLRRVTTCVSVTSWSSAKPENKGTVRSTVVETLTIVIGHLTGPAAVHRRVGRMHGMLANCAPLLC